MFPSQLWFVKLPDAMKINRSRKTRWEWNAASRPPSTWTSVGSRRKTFDCSRKERNSRFIPPAVHPPLRIAPLRRRTPAHAQAVAFEDRPRSFSPASSPCIQSCICIAWARRIPRTRRQRTHPSDGQRSGPRSRSSWQPWPLRASERASELSALPLSKHVKLKVGVAWRAKVART